VVPEQGEGGEVSCRQSRGSKAATANATAPGEAMTVLRSILLFVLAALAEIRGAWLVWRGVREQRGLVFVGAGILALGGYGFVATFQPDPHFGRILAAYVSALASAQTGGPGRGSAMYRRERKGSLPTCSTTMGRKRGTG
jgi:Uncharacterised BCR, YnfA/UPF0060 family